MSELPEVEIVSRLMSLAAQFRLEELEVQEGPLRVTLRAVQRTPEQEANGDGAVPYLWHPPDWLPPTPAEDPVRPETAQAIRAPLTGTFFRGQSPEVPPFVEVGDAVEEGQVVGLIEAMKVFSDVQVERGGVVLEIVAQNGRLVQHGDVLMYIDSLPAHPDI